jgi:hypothetical protein
MDEQLFEELLASVTEAGQILRSKREPSRVFVLDALDVRQIRLDLNLSQAQHS